MLEQIKNLCLFMVCGQTLLYFQSGKKYEKICRMILELLVLAGIVGMILNFLQSLGIQKGEMEAAGGAVAGMQRSMEEALSRQLGTEGMEDEFLSGDILDSLVEKHTIEEVKTRYNYFAQQYGVEIQDIEQDGETLQVFLKEYEGRESAGVRQGEEAEGETGQMEVSGEAEFAGDVAEIAEIEQIEIGEIELGEEEKKAADPGSEEKHLKKNRMKAEELEDFRRQFALVLAMEEEKLEVILID